MATTKLYPTALPGAANAFSSKAQRAEDLDPTPKGEKDKAGRTPSVFVELHLGYCKNIYGQGICTASGAAGSECYNTRFTCQDSANYLNETKIYRFTNQSYGVPPSVQHIPALIDPPSIAPTRIDPGRSLGQRARITVKFNDAAHHDTGIDKYATTRTYNPMTRGTYFGKLKARNPYYEGRTLRIRTGYITDPFSWDEFTSHDYIIESFEIDNGVVTITARDILSLADNDRLQVPSPTVATIVQKALGADDTDPDKTYDYVLITGDETQYPATGGMVAIDRELISYTAREQTAEGWALTGLTRGEYNSTIAGHNIDANIQLVRHIQNQNVVDLIRSFFVDDLGIPSSYINTTEWNTERDRWFLGANVTRPIFRPTGVKTLVEELVKQFLIRIWWDERTQKIRLSAVAPVDPDVQVELLTDDKNFLAGSMKVDDLTDKRLSRTIVFYAKRDYTEDDDNVNYQRVYQYIDATNEGTNLYDNVRTMVIKSEWLNEQNDASVLDFVVRNAAKFSDIPKKFTFRMDAKDKGIWVGDIVDISTDQHQDADGANKTTRVEIISAKEVDPGNTYEYEAYNLGADAQFTGTFAYIAPETLPDYTDSTIAERTTYWHYTDDDGLNPDGSTGDKLL